MSRRWTVPEYPIVLSLWTGFLPDLDTAYGPTNVNHNRTAADLARAEAHGEEFWGSNAGDAYFAMRPGKLSDDTPAWEFFEAVFATMNAARFRNVSRELLLTVRDRGLELGYAWAYCRTSSLLADRSRTRLTQVAASVTRYQVRRPDAMRDEDLWAFDLSRFVVP